MFQCFIEDEKHVASLLISKDIYIKNVDITMLFITQVWFKQAWIRTHMDLRSIGTLDPTLP
jgi:hypothetical protein